MSDDYSNEGPQDTSIKLAAIQDVLNAQDSVRLRSKNFAKFIEANIPENHLKNAALLDLESVMANCCLALMNEFTNKKGSN